MAVILRYVCGSTSSRTALWRLYSSLIGDRGHPLNFKILGMIWKRNPADSFRSDAHTENGLVHSPEKEW